jgi:PEP-CTERM motif
MGLRSQRTLQGIKEMKRFTFAAAAALSIAVPSLGHAAVLFDNGLVVSAGLSILATPASTFGFGTQTTSGNAVADNFTVAGSSWNVESLDFYSYQTGAVGFTFQQATWSIVSGDVNTGTVVASGVTNVTNGGLVGYRVTSTTLTDTQRAIYRLSTDIPDLVLATGNYYLRWSLTGTSASGPWTPPTTGSPSAAGNAYQSITNGAYATLVEAGSGLNTELPFTINGTRVTTAPAVPEPASWLMMLAGFGIVGGAMRRRATIRAAIA